MNESLDPAATVWQVGDVLEQALWVEALLTVVYQQPAVLDDPFTELISRLLDRQPARARG